MVGDLAVSPFILIVCGHVVQGFVASKVIEGVPYQLRSVSASHFSAPVHLNHTRL